MVHYHLTNSLTSPLIGITLFCAGLMDASHILVADRFVNSFGNNSEIIPFTWTIFRICKAVIVVGAVAIFLNQGYQDTRRTMHVIISYSLFLGAISYMLTHYYLATDQLPQIVFENQ